MASSSGSCARSSRSRRPSVIDRASSIIDWPFCRGVAFWAVGVSLAMYAINVGLLDLPWALRYRCAVGDTSGLWQIAPIQAVIFTGVMVASRVLLVVFSA
jgi:hypothetical protein